MMSRASSSEREKVWSLVMRRQTLMIARSPLLGSGGGRRVLSGLLEAKVFLCDWFILGGSGEVWLN